MKRYFRIGYLFLPRRTPRIMTGIGLQDFPWVILLSNKYTEGLDCHTNDLSGIVDPGQGLVGGDHGHQVGQRTESVVPTLGSVLLLKVIENIVNKIFELLPS